MTMKAVRIHTYGDINTLAYETAPKPEPTPDEVQIRIHAASINPVDWKTRKGQGIASLLTDSHPLILGWDVSGTISAVGDGVTTFAVGDEVYGMINFPQQGGAYAEYAVAPASHLARKPTTATHVEAAALPLVALTAWQALFDAANLKAGQRILIHAAAGGVGHVAVQLAKSVGAFVIGTASKRNEAYLLNLGVDQFINYRTTNFADVLTDQPVDVVLDTMAGDTRERSYGVINQSGVIVSILGDPSEEAAQYGLRGAGVFVRPNDKQLTQIAKLVDEGKLNPTVSGAFALADVGQAHEQSQSGRVRGKLVLEIG